MNSKSAVCVLWGSALLCASSASHAAQKEAKAPRFEQYSVTTYRGELKNPQDLHRDSEGVWRDEQNKMVSPPVVNFAGEYYLASHSCGTGCRYYTLNNLRTGREVSQISMFDAGEPTPLTKDGHTYVPILFFKPDSTLLIVQYDLDVDKPTRSNRCRQRFFVFKDKKLSAISRTFPSCTQQGGESE